MAMNGTRKAAGAALALVVTGAFVLVLGALPRAGAEEGPYPVWWSPRLELESLDAIDERLACPIWPEGGAIRVYKGERKRVTTPSSAGTCRDVLEAVRAGMSGWTGNEHELLRYHYAWCRPIEVLRGMAPATKSHVRDFRLDHSATSVLPALTLGLVSCEMLCRAVIMDRRGEPLRAFEPEARVVSFGDREADVVSTGWLARLRIVASGDANGDGGEDLVVISSFHATEGTLNGTDVFVLTRKQDNEVFRVLDAGHYVKAPCGRDYCDLR